MQDISYIVVNGQQYPVIDGTTVNIDGVEYTIEELLALAQNQPQQEPQQPEEVEETPTESNGDVSYVVVNGTKYSMDDAQATADLKQLTESVATSASIDESGLITFVNSDGDSVYSIQLPLFEGGES